MVHWCSLWGAQGHKEPHWWFHDRTQRVQLRVRLLEYTMSWPRWYELDTTWNIRDTISMTMISIKITRAPSNWKIMVDNQAESGNETSISDIILSLIRSRSRRHLCNYVPFWTWLDSTSQRYCRDINLVAVIISFLVSMKMTLPPIMSSEEHLLMRKR